MGVPACGHGQFCDCVHSLVYTAMVMYTHQLAMGPSIASTGCAATPGGVQERATQASLEGQGSAPRHKLSGCGCHAPLLHCLRSLKGGCFCSSSKTWAITLLMPLPQSCRLGISGIGQRRGGGSPPSVRQPLSGWAVHLPCWDLPLPGVWRGVTSAASTTAMGGGHGSSSVLPRTCDAA